MSSPLTPGLLILHGNRLELLRDTVLEWISQNPLEPLEEEIILVQSNGIGEWIKTSFALASGICAATRVDLPARFLWRLYRAVLGSHIPRHSPLDKDTLTLRLMRLLPEQLNRPEFAPIASFLQDGDPDRLLQLAQRLADLYDQYQIYRSDWLNAWEQGQLLLTGPGGQPHPLPDDQKWQALLWQTVLAELDELARSSTRPQVHRAVLAQLHAGPPFAEPLPRRVIVLGASTMPASTLDILVALSRHAQIILAVPNPCRFYWGDIIEGRELLRAERRRHPLRGGRELSAISLEAMHAHAHPLLAAWGRQGRDFLGQLEKVDETYQRQPTNLQKVDFFDESPGETLLEQVQAAIRDLLPLQEHPHNTIDAADRSIVFHIAHSRQREVEILHDALLQMLKEQKDLTPRQIVVMVPDISTFAPSIRAVFGQHSRTDSRFIPFDIADQQHRNHHPLLIACEWLLGIDQHRMGASEIMDLLDVPAVAQRFGLAPQDLPQLGRWIAGAGVRWGLDAGQRGGLGLQDCGEQNTWLFGLRRMLLGYASGMATEYAGIHPYDEIGGLNAALVGILDQLVAQLQAWWQLTQIPATPTEWAERGRALLAAWFQPQETQEQQLLAVLEDALNRWYDACERGSFTGTIPLSVFREGWMAEVDAPQSVNRFLAGGVTFCSLMPLRSIPFDVVCLLGMNDGDYPRQSQRNDFDLMRLPGQFRPGDRSRRDDDRYLMLEALLSARKTLYISWSGRSPRDNSVQPPSVLVSQLRDYLAAGWSTPENSRDFLQSLTTEHPLQPFSRRYFEPGGLLTYAREWRAAHEGTESPESIPMPSFESLDTAVNLSQLSRFLKNPVKTFFQIRLDVHFEDTDVPSDDETFQLEHLEIYQLLETLLHDPAELVRGDPRNSLKVRMRQLQLAGRLPIGAIGTRVAQELVDLALPMLIAWQQAVEGYPDSVEKIPLRYSHNDLFLDDWLGSLHGQGTNKVCINITPSRLLEKKRIRLEKLIDSWVRLLAASACGYTTGGILISRDATLQWEALPQNTAETHLEEILDLWREGLERPLPWAGKTALAAVQEGGNPREVYEGGYHGFAERQDPYLARIYPDFATLSADDRFASYAQTLFASLAQWAEQSVRVTPHAAAVEVSGNE